MNIHKFLFVAIGMIILASAAFAFSDNFDNYNVGVSEPGSWILEEHVWGEKALASSVNYTADNQTVSLPNSYEIYKSVVRDGAGGGAIHFNLQALSLGVPTVLNVSVYGSSFVGEGSCTGVLVRYHLLDTSTKLMSYVTNKAGSGNAQLRWVNNTVETNSDYTYTLGGNVGSWYALTRNIKDDFNAQFGSLDFDVNVTSVDIALAGASYMSQMGGTSGFRGYYDNVQLTYLTTVPTCWNGRDGAIHWYSHSDQATSLFDSCGGINGIEGGIPVYMQSGQWLRSIDYNNSGYFILNHSQAANFEDGTWSVSTWFKYDASSTRTIFFVGGDPTNRNSLLINVNPTNYAAAYVWNQSSASGVTTDSTLVTDTWYHIVVTSELGGDLKIYLNGMLNDTIPTRTFYYADNKVTIGALRRGGYVSPRFQGNIDEFVIFDYALLPSDILGMYNANTINRFPIVNITVPVNGSSYEASSNVNLGVSAFDENLTNLTVDVTYPNGTVIATYFNASGGASVTVSDEFISSLPIFNGLICNVSAVDNGSKVTMAHTTFNVTILSAVLTVSDVSAGLPTYWAVRDIRAEYFNSGGGALSGSYARGGIGNTIPIGSSSNVWLYCDWLNDTHFACYWRGAYGQSNHIDVYTNNGTKVSGCNVEAVAYNSPSGFYCRSSDQCYFSYTYALPPGNERTYIKKIYLSNCTQVQMITWTKSQRGYNSGGLVQLSNGSWLVNGGGNLTLLDSSFNQVNMLETSHPPSSYWDGVNVGAFFALYGTNLSQWNISDGGLVASAILNDSSMCAAMFSRGSIITCIGGQGVHRGVMYWWDVNYSRTYPANASCNFSWSTTGLPMSYDGSYHTASFIETNADHTIYNGLVQCSSSDSVSLSSIIALKTHNWVTPVHSSTGSAFTAMGTYKDTDPFDVQLYGTAAELSCVQVYLEGNSLTSNDELAFYLYEKNHTGSHVMNMTLREHVSGYPNTNSFLASCLIPVSGGLINKWLSCTTTSFQNLTLDTTYFVCANSTVLGDNWYAPLTGNRLAYGALTPPTWESFTDEPGMTLVTQNTDKVTHGNVSGDYYIYGFVWDCADPTRKLAGVAINLTQVNSTDINSRTAYTDATGYFAIDNIWANVEAHITYTHCPYESYARSFTLDSMTMTKNMSKCLSLQIPPVDVHTTWNVYSNTTAASEKVYTYTEWKPNETYLKDSLLLSISAYVEDSNRDPLEGINFSQLEVTTTCSYATLPTAYYLEEFGSGKYILYATIGGVNVTGLYAFCEEGDYFEVHYIAPGLSEKTRLTFEAYNMRVTNVGVLVDTMPTYNWAYAIGDFYYNMPEEGNTPIDVYNLSCEMRLEYLNGTNFTGWETATVIGNKAVNNFTSLSGTPATVNVHFNCSAWGFDALDTIIAVSVGTDLLYTANCYIVDNKGDTLQWNKVNAQIQHVCEFRTYKNVSLRNLVVRSKNDNFNRERTFFYSYDINSTWMFTTSLIADDMPKGLHSWIVHLSQLPTGLSVPVTQYYQFVKVYWTPPKKISPDYCVGSNCLDMVYKGQNYYCRVTTEFEADYTLIIMGVKINGGELITLDHVDDFNENTGIHVTSIEIPGVGETGLYGLTDDGTIQCYAELHIDQEYLCYGSGSGDMVTQYEHDYMLDFIGLQSFWSAFLASDEPVEFAVNWFLGLPGWFFSKMGIFDESGNFDAILLLLYMIGLALLGALAIVLMHARHSNR